MQGRRKRNLDGVRSPGDYTTAKEGSQLVLHFLLPTAGDAGQPLEAYALHSITSPPYGFRGESDGTLTVDGLIDTGCWKGHLNRGFWYERKSGG